MFPAIVDRQKHIEAALLPCSALNPYEFQETICLVVAVWEIERQRAALTIWDGTWPKCDVQREPYSAALLGEEPFLVDCLRPELLHVVIIGECDTSELLTTVGNYTRLKGIQLLSSAGTKQLHIVLDLRYRRHGITKVFVPPSPLEALLNKKKADYNEINVQQNSFRQSQAKGYSETGNRSQPTQLSSVPAESQNIVFETEETSCGDVTDKGNLVSDGARRGVESSETNLDTCADVANGRTTPEVIPTFMKACEKSINPLNPISSIIHTGAEEATKPNSGGVTSESRGSDGRKEMRSASVDNEEHGIVGSTGNETVCIRSNTSIDSEGTPATGNPNFRATEGRGNVESTQTPQNDGLMDTAEIGEKRRDNTSSAKAMMIRRADRADKSHVPSSQWCKELTAPSSQPAHDVPDSAGRAGPMADLDIAVVSNDWSVPRGPDTNVGPASRICGAAIVPQSSYGTEEHFGLNPTILQITEWGKPTLYKSLPPVLALHERHQLKPTSIAALKARKPPFECRVVARIGDVLPNSASPRNFIWASCIKCGKSIALPNLVCSEDRVPRRLPCPICTHSKLSLRFLLGFRLVDPSGTIFAFAKCKDANNLLAGYRPEEVYEDESVGAEQVSRLIRQMRPCPKLCEQTFVDLILSAYKDRDATYYRIVHTCARVTS